VSKKYSAQMLNSESKNKKINPTKVKLPFSERVAIVESLGVMLKAGIPILDALDSIEQDSTSQKTKQVVQLIRDSIQKGKSLADGFSQFPNVFDKILINTIKSGEESGNLDTVLNELTKSMKRTEELKNDIRSAMVYPAIVLGVLFFVLVVLLGFVVPRIAEVFNRLSIPKPLATRILLNSSTFFSDYLLYFAIFSIVLIIFTVFLFSRKGIRKKIYTASFRLPFIGSILKYLDLARFSGTLALLLSAGIPIIRAVESSATVVVNQKTFNEISEITHSLTKGESLSVSMRKYKTFPTLMTRIISTGEKTGKLDDVLAGVSNHYHTKLQSQVKVLATSIEPILIVIIGVIVGLVIIAIISPIYQLIGQISPR
jgi:type IV pilus assembly protein PilC